MTPAGTQRSQNTMASGTGPSRPFSNFADAAMNGSDKAQHIRNAFSSTGWQANGIWSSNGIGSFARNREAVGSRDLSDAFPSATSGSGALAATSEANPWGNRPGPWNSTETTQTRTVSDSTSPSRSRPDSSVHDMNGNSAYYSGTPAIAQRGPVGSKPPSAGDTSTGPFKYASPFSGYADEKESNGAFGQSKHEHEQRLGKFTVAQRPAQEPSFLNAVGTGPSRDAGMPPSSQAQSDLHAQADALSDFSYSGRAATSMHSQRPSLAGPSVSYPDHNSRGYDQSVAQQTDKEELAERLGRILGIGSNSTPDSLSSIPTYANGSQTFQFDPVSQPWENGQGYQAGFARDTYANGAGFERRGSLADRGSASGSTYRTGAGLNSPRSFTGTPQPNVDSWSRPGSRDHRIGADIDRRSLGQQFAQQHAAPLYSNPYFNTGYQQLPNIYDQYPPLRHPVPIPGYGMPLPPYPFVPGAVPIRPGADRDPGRGVRSLLLEEFRSTSKSNKRYELKDIYNHIVEFSGDQHGSRFIQQKLETANSDEKDQVFREIEPNAIQLMKDVFGNYVIQKFFEHGNQVQKKILALAMKGKVVDLSTQMYACRVVQKALEHVLVEQQAELVKELEPDVLKVIRDQNGNHVVQQVIALVPRQYIDFVIDALRGRVGELSTHTYGCRVIQRVLEHGTEADKAALMKELHGCAHLLVTDQYGNYVTQHVIDKGSPDDRSKMISFITSQVLTLSKHKFASNVVETCIKCGTLEQQRAIRDQLMASGDDANSPLFQLMKDQYGNYVIQKLLTTLQGHDREILVEALRPHFVPLKKSGATGRQIAAIDRLISAISTPTSGTRDSTPSSTAPTSPGLRVDVSSAAPTPSLTMGPNSPLTSPSTSPPCTKAGAVEQVTDHAVAQLAAKGNDLAPE
ncbi:hypothetical protein VTK56DRAFT_9540 [Thermocarpiscus australiensis]